MSKNDLPADWHFRRVFIVIIASWNSRRAPARNESEFLGPGGSYSHIAPPPAIACIARAFFSCLFRRRESPPAACLAQNESGGRTEGGGGCNRLACCLHRRRRRTNHPSCEKSPHAHGEDRGRVHAFCLHRTRPPRTSAAAAWVSGHTTCLAVARAPSLLSDACGGAGGGAD